MESQHLLADRIVPHIGEDAPDRIDRIEEDLEDQRADMRQFPVLHHLSAD